MEMSLSAPAFKVLLYSEKRLVVAVKGKTGCPCRDFRESSDRKDPQQQVILRKPHGRGFRAVELCQHPKAFTVRAQGLVCERPFSFCVNV